MSPEEETFFTAARVPVLLAAAAYSEEREFAKLPFIDYDTIRVEVVCKKLEPYMAPSAGVNSKENVMVHVAVIPVDLPSDANDIDARDDAELHSWDLALVYRGTEPFNVKNWITDLSFEQEPVDDDILGHTDRNQQGQLQVHQGFHRAFRSIHPKRDESESISQDWSVSNIATAVQEVKAEFKSNLRTRLQRAAEGTGSQQSNALTRRHDRLRSKVDTFLANPTPRRVLCIGHSLGGALATLAAAWCKTTLCRDSAFLGSPVHCITVGSPRVGNGEFKQAWNQLLNPLPSASLCYRIVNALDPVPSVPPRRMYMFWNRYRYEHVGVPVYLERRVENWSIAVIAHLNKERPWGNCVSLFDHFQWKYSSAMVAAEVSSQQRSPDSGNRELPKSWVYWMKRQLKCEALHSLFREIVEMDIPMTARFWMLFWSWVLGIIFLFGTPVMWFVLVFALTILLPFLTCVFFFDWVLQILLRPFLPLLQALFQFKFFHRVLRILLWPFVALFEFKAVDGHIRHYTPGNLSIAALSAAVMVITYGAVWAGL